MLYLIFNEGYAASARRGPRARRAVRRSHPARPGWSAEASPTTPRSPDSWRSCCSSTPAGRPEPIRDGNLVPLAEQDRNLWDETRIAEGTSLLDSAIAKGAVGEYQIQAAIAAIHDRAPTAADTDWPQILSLYGLLERMTGNPVVTVNRAVAAAMANGPAAGLAVLDEVDGAMSAPLQVDRCSRPPSRDGRRHRWRPRPVQGRRQADAEPPGAALPDGPRGPTAGGRAVSWLAENQPHPPLTMSGGAGRPRFARDAGASSVVFPSDRARSPRLATHGTRAPPSPARGR